MEPYKSFNEHFKKTEIQAQKIREAIKNMKDEGVGFKSRESVIQEVYKIMDGLGIPKNFISYQTTNNILVVLPIPPRYDLAGELVNWVFDVDKKYFRCTDSPSDFFDITDHHRIDLMFKQGSVFF